MNENIQKLINDSLPIMVSEVLAHAKELKLSSPLARLKFWYYDTCAPKCYFIGSALTEADRVRILRDDGVNAAYNLWNGSGSIEITVGLKDESQCTPYFAQAYEMMGLSAQERENANLSEQANEVSRLLAQALSRHLNKLDWSEVCSVTDDFIVYAQNGTDRGCDCYEDITASVPKQKLELLIARGLMGEGSNYDSIEIIN